MPNGTATAAPPHHNPERLLEEILGELSPAEKTNFEDHLTYRSPENLARMRTEQFVTVTGGTEKLFDDVYHNAYRVATQSGLKGKADPKAVADTLELVVIEALKKIQRPIETFQWKNFETLKETNGFRSDDERLSHLVQLASNYLGADEQELATLINSLRRGDPLMWNQAMREFTNKLKESVIEKYIDQHRLKAVPPDAEHKFKAYAVKELREKHGVTPTESLPRYLSTLTPLRQALQHLDLFRNRQSQLAYAGAGVTPYQQPRR